MTSKLHFCLYLVMLQLLQFTSGAHIFRNVETVFHSVFLTAKKVCACHAIAWVSCSKNAHFRNMTIVSFDLNIPPIPDSGDSVLWIWQKFSGDLAWYWFLTPLYIGQWCVFVDKSPWWHSNSITLNSIWQVTYPRTLPFVPISNTLWKCSYFSMFGQIPS